MKQIDYARRYLDANPTASNLAAARVLFARHVGMWPNAKVSGDGTASAGLSG